MVDNFDKIRSLLKFEKEGDCYYLQLLRRQSDDPMKDGMPDPNYHGNMHSRSLKDYLIPSLEYFDNKKEEIKHLCDEFNVRAYIRLNKRTYNKVSMSMLKHIVEQLTSGQSFNSPYSLVASAAGNANAAGKDKTWILDLDAEYLPHKSKIYSLILQCEPYATKYAIWCSKAWPNDPEKRLDTFLEENFVEIPTKHGLHIICKGFNTQTFKTLWVEYTKVAGITAPLPQMKNEEDKIVFSLTDYYLKHVDGFFKILLGYGHAKKIPMDKNKTIIHWTSSCSIESFAEVLSAIECDWARYCLDRTLFMKAPDMHHDNPTILYVP